MLYYLLQVLSNTELHPMSLSTTAVKVSIFHYIVNISDTGDQPSAFEA